jgi:very-short-patch-repair endonuclease
MAKNIIVGQKVTYEKKQRARELRREMTREERILWQELRGGKIEGLHFRRQQVIDGFIADFYCHEARLVIEVDGGSHEEAVEYDIERSQILAHRRLRVLRFQNAEIINALPTVIEEIVSVCRKQLGKP